MGTSSTLTSIPRDTSLHSSLNAMALYHAQRGADGTISDFRLVMLNNPAVKTWGLPQGELVGRSIYQLFNEAEAQYLLRQFRLVVDTGRAVRFEMDYQRSSDATPLRYDMLVTGIEDGVMVSFDQLSQSQATESPHRPETQADPYESPQPESVSLRRAVTKPTPATLLGLLVVGLSLSVLAGWVFNLPWLYSLGSSVNTTKGITALLLLLTGTELLLVSQMPNQWERLKTGIAIVLLTVPFGIGVNLILLENAGLLGWWPIRSTASVWAWPSFMATLCFTLLGAAFLLIRRPRTVTAGQFLTLLSTLLVFVAFLGYATDVQAFYTLGIYSGIAMPTALGLFASGLGVLCLTRQKGILRTLIGSFWGGMTFRYMGLYVLLMPALLSAVYLMFVARQGIDPQIGLLIIMYLYIVGAFVLFYFFSRHLDAMDGQRQHQLDRLRSSEAEIREQFTLLNGIQNASQAGISALKVVRNQGGAIIDFEFVVRNEAFQRLTGQTMSEVLGQRLLSVYPNIQTMGMFDRYVQVVETGVTQQFEQYFGANGVDSWFDVNVCRWGDGIVIDINDITARKQAELAALQQRELLQSVVDNTAAGMVLARPIRDARGQLIDFEYVITNEHNARTTGRSADELMGSPMGVVFPGWQASEFFRTFVQVAETGQARQLVFPFNDQGIQGWFDGTFCRIGDCVLYTYLNVTALKEAEQRAQRQADLLASIQNTSKLGLVIYEAVHGEASSIIDFKPIWRNAESVRMTGATDAEAQKTPLSQLLPTLRHTGLMERYKEVMEKGQAIQFEHYHPHDGIEEWFEITAQPFDGGILVNVLETTELRRVQREKLEQATFTETVLNSVTSGVLSAQAVRDADGTLTDLLLTSVNERAVQFVGLTMDKMIGQRLGVLFPGIYQTDVFALYAQTIEQAQPQELEIHYKLDGLDVWAFIQTQPLGDGLVITWTDIGDRKRDELQIQEQAELLAQIMNTTPTSIVVHESIRDEAGEIIDFRMTRLNQTAAHFLKNPIEKIQHRRISRYFPGVLEMPLFNQYKEVVQTGKPLRTEVQWENQWFDFSVARFGDGMIVATQDITAIRQYQHQLELANYELKRSNEGLQSFAYVASHDLQEPLRKITSFADVLQTEYTGQFDANATDILRRMNDSAVRMRTLIQDLLTYSRVETHQETLKPINLSRLIEKLREEELWAAFYQSKADLQMPDMPVIMGDPFQIRQLIQNLMSNAIKFCPKGRTPLITVAYRQVGRDEVPTDLLSPTKLWENKSVANQFHEISFTDNGIGFDPKYVNRIFQIFQRLHGKSQYSGSGIGLAICQKIAERHGGAITASSELGKGSTFRVYLPV